MAAADPVAAITVAEAPALHIPDGFVSAPVAAGGWVLAAAVIALAARRADRNLDERAAPLMGVMAAFIFAGQMVNFPVAGGTSGHLVGGALAAILLGPWAAIIVMTAVVALQALLFQDGGLAALGVNTLNMAVLSVLVGWGVYRVLQPLGGLHPALAAAAAFAAAWLSVEAAAVATTLQLAASATSPLTVALPAMVGVHALIGIGEGLITLGALGLVRAARPDLLTRPARAEA
ncbi:MAG: energy-coupling factor ABC transporter permease [Chloroflexota bacterium]|nr:energy-coupling factor ABC transporter permease [Chloroflexota bacterium]